MKYLITGNLGYIGPILSKFIKLNDPKSEIIGYDMGYFSNCPIAAEEFYEKPNVDLQVFADVRNKNKIAPFIKEADYIIHLAAISNDPMGIEFKNQTKQINQESSIFIAKEAIKSKTKAFVFASSCSVYGEGSDKPRTEEDPVKPLTAYARSKIGTENILMDLSNCENTKITFLRFATACGYSPNLRLDLVLNDFVANALSTGVIEILSDGSPWRPLIDVEDMARAIFWSCHRKEGSQKEILNVGSPRWNYQIKDLAKTVKEILGNDIKLKINHDASPDKRSYKVSFDKFYELADKKFTPQIDIYESVKRMTNALTPYKNRISREDRGHLIRLNVLKRLKQKNFLDQDLNWHH